jgi:hypothetical protein
MAKNFYSIRTFHSLVISLMIVPFIRTHISDVLEKNVRRTNQPEAKQSAGG